MKKVVVNYVEKFVHMFDRPHCEYYTYINIIYINFSANDIWNCNMWVKKIEIP